jgi:hypothetical protein
VQLRSWDDLRRREEEVRGHGGGEAATLEATRGGESPPQAVVAALLLDKAMLQDGLERGAEVRPTARYRSIPGRGVPGADMGRELAGSPWIVRVRWISEPGRLAAGGRHRPWFVANGQNTGRAERDANLATLYLAAGLAVVMTG